MVSNNRAGNGTQWLTAWPGTVEALTIFKPGERMTMFMEWHNHIPLAKLIARDVDVFWGEHEGIVKTIAELKRRGAQCVGVMGPLPAGKLKQLEAQFSVKPLDADYTRLRMIKSEEELDWLRIGATLSDAGLTALIEGARSEEHTSELQSH